MSKKDKRSSGKKYSFGGITKLHVDKSGAPVKTSSSRYSKVVPLIAPMIIAAVPT